jgi:hypothetical protein
MTRGCIWTPHSDGPANRITGGIDARLSQRHDFDGLRQRGEREREKAYNLDQKSIHGESVLKVKARSP